jgi:hypothetical protein
MGVFVLGMHRSGTSAVTRVVNLLGVPIGRMDRLMAPQADNPEGFWEHLALMDVNDKVLARLGGSWDAPPAFEVLADVELDDLREVARREFSATYEGDRFVYKDPRLGLLLPFWRDLIRGVNEVAIVVLRNPLDIAASLARRNDFAITYALALWEHYTHAMLHDAVGLPVLVVAYDQLVDDAGGVTDAIAGFVHDHDQLAGEANQRGIAAYVRGELRHTSRDRAALDADRRVSIEQRVLYDMTTELLGRHEPLASLTLPRMTPSTEVLIAARRAPMTVEQQTLDAIVRSLGATEQRLAGCERDCAAMRPTFDAVKDALGYDAIGRLERSALGVARRARELQQRLARS